MVYCTSGIAKKQRAWYTQQHMRNVFFVSAKTSRRIVYVDVDESQDLLVALDNFFKMRTIAPTTLETLSIHTADATRVLHNEIARAIEKGYAAGRIWNQ